jgi:hypothetical protein
VAIGAVVSLLALAGGFGSDSLIGAGAGVFVGVGAIVVIPLLYGGLAFIATLIAVWLYNVAAGMVGGIEVDVK